MSVVVDAPTVSVTVIGVDPKICAAVERESANFRIKLFALPAGSLIVKRLEVTPSYDAV